MGMWGAAEEGPALSLLQSWDHSDRGGLISSQTSTHCLLHSHPEWTWEVHLLTPTTSAPSPHSVCSGKIVNTGTQKPLTAQSRHSIDCNFIETTQRKVENTENWRYSCGQENMLYDRSKHAQMLDHAHARSFMHRNTQHTLRWAMTPVDRLKSMRRIIQLWWSRKNNCMRLSVLCLGLIREISESGRSNTFKSCKSFVYTEVIRSTPGVYSYYRVLDLIIINSFHQRLSLVALGPYELVLMYVHTGFWCKGKRP